jgi:hypothetical protein
MMYEVLLIRDVHCTSFGPLISRPESMGSSRECCQIQGLLHHPTLCAPRPATTDLYNVEMFDGILGLQSASPFTSIVDDG